MGWLNGYPQSNFVSGRVVVDEGLCSGCRSCTIICPASALEMGANRRSRMKKGADCVSCGACTAVCQSGAIRIVTFYHVPDGAYATSGRVQMAGPESFPRDFGGDTRGKRRRK